MIHPYHGTQLSNRRQATETHNDLDESQNNYAQRTAVWLPEVGVGGGNGGESGQKVQIPSLNK